MTFLRKKERKVGKAGSSWGCGGAGRTEAGKEEESGGGGKILGQGLC